MSNTTDHPAPSVGDPVVIIEGLPFEMTWDYDGDDEASGVEGTLTGVDAESQAPYEVRTADGVTFHAAKVRVIDDAYRAEEAAKAARYQAIDLRRLELLEEALSAYAERLDVPATVRAELRDLMQAARTKSYAEFPVV